MKNWCCPVKTGNLSTSLHDRSRMKPARRRFLKRLLAGVTLPVVGCAAEPAWAVENASAASDQQTRFALLVGNGLYPAPYDLPPVHKNVFDLAQALAYRGFDVTQALDLDATAFEQTLTEFIARIARVPNALTLFYYAGHGMQVNASNLLLGSGSSPKLAKPDLLAQSVVLQNNLLARLPQRDSAVNITVIDACRTDIRAALGDADGLNQVEAPLGSMVCFSTAAGRPAVSPASPDQNTFYTASLVKKLRELPDHTTFSELFQLVKVDVEQTMLNFPLEAIRQLAQVPFIADNTRRKVALAWHQPGLAGRAQAQPSAAETERWAAMQAVYWPVDLIRLAQSYLQNFPDSVLRDQVSLVLAGAKKALGVLRSNEVHLYKSSFVAPEQNPAAQEDLNRAGRGDKDAAARMGHWYRRLGTEAAMLRFEGWMQFATGLGNGIASYELALHYRDTGLALPAAQAEARARALGYVPPRSLGHERK